MQILFIVKPFYSVITEGDTIMFYHRQLDSDFSIKNKSNVSIFITITELVVLYSIQLANLT